jgi:amidohydrolase
LFNPNEYIDQHKDALLKTYQDLHILAEPSWEEKETSRYLVDHLKKAGLTVKTFHNHFGIIAEIPGHSNKVVALRADMDALVQEVDGKVRPNHSCGHDAHSTMVLFAALSIVSSGILPKHTLRFIFQPAEEKGEGALQMMKDGALEHVEYLFGIHVRPEVEVPYLNASPVIVHGSAGTLKGMIKGVQSHASRPQDGINVIEAAALLVYKLKQIHIQTEITYSIKMTQFKTENEAANVIPETAFFSIDVRAQTNEVMDELTLKAKEAMEETMNQMGPTITWSMEEFVPAAAIHKKAIRLVEIAIEGVLGKENVIASCVTNGAEDFHFYTNKKPTIAATMVGLGCGLKPGLHHPKMNFHLDALIYGAKIVTQAILLASEE